MPDSPTDARHLTVVTLDELWRSGAPIELPVKGEPGCRLQFEPKLGLMRLVTVYEPPEPDVARLKNLDFRPVAAGAENLGELTVRTGDNVYAAYGLLASIADELQVEHRPLAAAVASAVARQRNVLTTRAGLTAEEEIGLCGELIFLEFLIGVLGAEPATSAWNGPLAEEHDFIFDDIHLEVKTTASEQRKHIINGLAQLVPVPGIPLSLVSIQVTRATATGGDSLPELVERVRGAAGGHTVRLDAMLSAAGWDQLDADLYPTRWRLRSKPRAFSVSGPFPALTPTVLAGVVPNFGLVSDVTYRVDLTGLDYEVLPEPFSSFVDQEKPK